MSNYLDRMVARAHHESPVLAPRKRSRFEPDQSAPLDEPVRGLETIAGTPNPPTGEPDVGANRGTPERGMQSSTAEIPLSAVATDPILDRAPEGKAAHAATTLPPPNADNELPAAPFISSTDAPASNPSPDLPPSPAIRSATTAEQAPPASTAAEPQSADRRSDRIRPMVGRSRSRRPQDDDPSADGDPHEPLVPIDDRHPRTSASEVRAHRALAPPRPEADAETTTRAVESIETHVASQIGVPLEPATTSPFEAIVDLDPASLGRHTTTTAAEPVVRVSIGRVDVQAAQPQTKARPRRRAAAGPSLTLAAYLAARNEARRR